MGLIKITDLSHQLGLSSRSLRYYEQVGLIQSVRPQFEKYRFYDSENIERLRQIIVLRKMQIPIKDILRIFESESMSILVETFVNRIHAIDNEIGALAELKRIVGEFLQTMIQKGVTRISALPLLYDEMDKQFELMEEHKPTTMDDLNAVSERLARLMDISIVALPPLRVLSSYLKAHPTTSDTDGFSRFAQASGIAPGTQGNHEHFEFQTDAGDVEIRRISDEYINTSDYLEYTFSGGLFAAMNVYLDEDLGERFRSLVKSFDDNKYYQIDYTGDGNLRHPALLENVISPDDRRELVALLVPVKKRLADPALFDKPEEVAGISVAEIEAANPVLWEVEVPLENLTQTHVNNSYFRINEDGEAEYIGWIIRAVLNTNVSVKLPFRIDIEFRQSGNGKTGIIFYHSEDTGYHAGGGTGNRSFGINRGNDNEQMVQAIHFHQPIFWDGFHFPGRGAIKTDKQTRLIWIVGEKHLAVIINDEVRYCGINFPYMSLDLSCEETQPIVIGAHGNDKIYFRSIRISQLVETKKNILKEGELTMITKQSNTIIPVIHRLVTDEYGENYWFNGCARYVMECLGEKDYDYWFFAGLTGDVFTQHYTYTKYSGDALSCYMMQEKPAEYTEEIFAKCGYAATFVSKKELRNNTEMYLQTLIAYIDKGIPVILWANWAGVGVVVGYEDYGKVLLYITGNNNQPERMPLEKMLESKPNPEAVDKVLEGNPDKEGWIFVGDKKENRPLAEFYREAIYAIPQHLNVKTDTYCFGAEAFRAWAQGIENGKFDSMAVEEFDTWAYYTNYVCVLATNGSCCHEFLKRARELNPEMGFLEQVSHLYKKTADIWNNQNGEDLEALGGGFNVTLTALQDKDKRAKIAAKIRECADVIDQVMQLIQANM